MPKNTNFEAIPHLVQAELFRLNSIIGLAAFAAEARRTLREIDAAVQGVPATEKRLSVLVRARNQWKDCPDTLGDVLEEVHFRLSLLLGSES